MHFITIITSSILSALAAAQWYPTHQQRDFLVRREAFNDYRPGFYEDLYAREAFTDEYEDPYAAVYSRDARPEAEPEALFGSLFKIGAKIAGKVIGHKKHKQRDLSDDDYYLQQIMDRRSLDEDWILDEYEE